MSTVRVWEQIGLLFTILFFWLIGNEDLLLLRRFEPAEWINLAFTVLVVYAMWGLFRLLLRQLSPLRKRYSTSSYYLLQAALSFLILLPFLYWVNYLYIYHYWQMTFEENYFREVIFPLAMVFVLLWNLVDFIYMYIMKIQQEKALVNLQQDTPPHSPGLFLMATRGKDLQKVLLNDLAYITVQDQLTRAITHSGECHLLNDTLSKLEQKLPTQQFFRANRQTILSRKAVQRVRRESNQKLLVGIHPITDWVQDCTVSRYKAADFMNWWQV